MKQATRNRTIFFGLCVWLLSYLLSPFAVVADNNEREKLLKTPMPVWPSEPMSDADRKQASELFTQMAKAPEELKSGIVDGVSIRFFEREEDTRTHTWHYVFDKMGRKRFKNLTRRRTHHYIHTGQEILTWLETPGRLRPHSIDRKNVDTKRILHEALPPHLDRLGFAGGAMFSTGSFDFAGLKRMIVEKSPQQFVGLRETKDNQILLMKEYRLASPRNDEEAKQRYRSAFWLDPEKGHRQVQFAEWCQTSEDADWTLINVWTVVWTQIHSVYVPEYYLALSNQHGVSGTELKLKWKSVNTPIEDAEFEWQKFNPPIGTEIVNWKTGERIVESRVGDPNLLFQR